jgi:AhpD family alkylhydroperoxidase
VTGAPAGPARIGPGSLRDTGPLIWAFARLAGRVTGTTPPHVFTTLGRGRGLFWGWLHVAGRLMPGGKLPRCDTELVILRVAHLRECQYEFDHHERLGRRAGLDDAAIERVRTNGPDGWTDRRRLLLRATDELVLDRDIDDATWTALRGVLDERTSLELVLLVTHYDMLATTLLTLRVPPDRPR